MKLISKSMLAALIWTATGPVLANEKPLSEEQITLKTLNQNRVELTYVGEAPENFSVKITNDRNQKVFQEYIRNKSSFKKPYDLSNLPYGEYKFEIKVNDQRFVREVSIQAPEFPGNVKVNLTGIEHHKVKYMVMGPESKEMNLRIYDDKNQLLLEEWVVTSGNFGKVYAFKDTQSHHVQFVLSDNGNVIHREKVRL